MSRLPSLSHVENTREVEKVDDINPTYSHTVFFPKGRCKNFGEHRCDTQKIARSRREENFGIHEEKEDLMSRLRMCLNRERS
eukprot:752346-Hanusia_phi.AAC.2